MSVDRILVSGTATSADFVRVNGLPATLMGEAFSVPVPLDNGTNTITAIATNDLGDATDSITVILHTSPAQLSIEAPPDGTVTDFEALTVTGTLTGAADTVVVNGVTATIVGSRFSASGVPLVPGPNAIQALALLTGTPVATDQVTVQQAAEPVLQVQILSRANTQARSRGHLPKQCSVPSAQLT